tara:strand:+ start:358 stop:543 length:186 start_codon:yes stop_codon:yes gene_type:complete
MNNEMDITQAKYYNSNGETAGIKLTLADGSVWSVPRRTGNRHYDEIKRQVDAGTLTIAAAD